MKIGPQCKSDSERLARRKASRLRWYLKNKHKPRDPDRSLHFSRLWRKNNLEVYRQQSLRYSAKRRAILLGRLHPDHNFDLEKMLVIARYLIQKATGIPHHIDHIIPLSAGGWHHHLNLQILPASLNVKKHDNIWAEIPGFRNWRMVPEFLWPEKMQDLLKNILTKEMSSA